MKILIVSLLRRRLGPEVTASRARVVYNLAQGLVSRGHHVSILGPGTSTVAGATIIPIISAALNELPPFENQFYTEIGYLVKTARLIQQKAPEFDIIHNHAFPEYVNLLVEETLPVPMLTTLHVPYSNELEQVLEQFPHAQIVAQSEAYRGLLRKMDIPWVVRNGIDSEFFTYSEKPRDYLLWIGRLGCAKDANGKFFDGKGVHEAILVAKQTRKKLIMVGNSESKEFYEKEVTLHLSQMIQWKSPISAGQTHSREEIRNLIQGAKALLFTTKFEESFGLVAAEAMACGTPVVGFAKGSLIDIVTDGETGLLVNPSDSDKRGKWQIVKTGVDGLSDAIEKLYSFPKEKYNIMQKAARKRIEENFTLEKMVSNYEDLYKKLIKK